MIIYWVKFILNPARAAFSVRSSRPCCRVLRGYKEPSVQVNAPGYVNLTDVRMHAAVRDALR